LKKYLTIVEINENKSQQIPANGNTIVSISDLEQNIEIMDGVLVILKRSNSTQATRLSENYKRHRNEAITNLESNKRRIDRDILNTIETRKSQIFAIQANSPEIIKRKIETERAGVIQRQAAIISGLATAFTNNFEIFIEYLKNDTNSIENKITILQMLQRIYNMLDLEKRKISFECLKSILENASSIRLDQSTINNIIGCMSFMIKNNDSITHEDRRWFASNLMGRIYNNSDQSFAKVIFICLFTIFDSLNMSDKESLLKLVQDCLYNRNTFIEGALMDNDFKKLLHDAVNQLGVNLATKNFYEKCIKYTSKVLKTLIPIAHSVIV